jgi:hypothetical protein
MLRPNGIELSAMPPSDMVVSVGDVGTISKAYINRTIMDYTICGVNEVLWEDVLNNRLPAQGATTINGINSAVRSLIVWLSGCRECALLLTYMQYLQVI